jgi:hypothetical protein
MPKDYKKTSLALEPVIVEVLKRAYPLGGYATLLRKYIHQGMDIDFPGWRDDTLLEPRDIDHG